MVTLVLAAAFVLLLITAVSYDGDFRLVVLGAAVAIFVAVWNARATRR